MPPVPAATGNRKMDRLPVCFAHRGARAHAPENTLVAFDLAFDLGADAIECDVQLTSDGKLVIMHDGSVDRTTDGSGTVASLRCEDIRTLNAGARWRMSARVPTLDETLELAHARGHKEVNIELKAETVAGALATATALARNLGRTPGNFRGCILVSSFFHDALLLLRERLPWLRIGLLMDRNWRRRDMIAPAVALQAEAIHPAVSLVTGDLVQHAHAAGLLVHAWTANRASAIRALVDLEVDGIFSDFPERVIIVRRLLVAAAGSRAETL